MLNHLKLKHPCLTSRKPASTSKQSTLGSVLSLKRCDPERSKKITELIAEMIATESFPISLVATDGFRKLLAYLEPGYTVPCRTTVSAQLNLMFQTKIEAVKDNLKAAESVSLTTDYWTSFNLEGYVTVPAHFVQDWQHYSTVLDTSPVGLLDGGDVDNDGPQRHTAEALAKQLKRIAEEWGVDQKISAVVHDYASNIKDIGNRSPSVSDVGCAAHTLQLSINKSLQYNSAIEVLIGGTNRLVGHFKHSTVATKVLEVKQQQMDCPKHRLTVFHTAKQGGTLFLKCRNA